MTNVINFSDIVEGNGKTIRQNNLEREHTIAIGRLVECLEHGVRMYVWGYGRDCDGTPLYHLTADQDLVGVEILPSGFPDDFEERAEALAPVFMGEGRLFRDCVLAAKILLAEQLGEKRGKIHWNYTSEEGLRVVDVHTVDEVKEREMFEYAFSEHDLSRKENGDYAAAFLQEIWLGWSTRATKKEFQTLDTELWKSPFISLEERLEIADGAVAWRNDVINNLRSKLERAQRRISTLTHATALQDIVPDDDPISRGNTDQLIEWFERTFVADAVMPTVKEMNNAFDQHPIHVKFEEDSRLFLMREDLDSYISTSEFQYRLAYRAPLRRALELCREHGIEVNIDIDLKRS